MHRQMNGSKDCVHRITPVNQLVISIMTIGMKDEIPRIRNNSRNKEEKKMKGFSEKWDRLFSAVTFAEAGEFDTAREILREKDRDQKRDTKVVRKTARLSAPGAKR